MAIMLGFCLFLSVFCNIVSALQCVDQNNNDVDWFVVYKLPDIKENSKLDKGTGYTFVTSNNYNKWILSDISINDTNSLIGLTLQPLYANSDILHILYNDEPPNEVNSNSYKGHTKGVVLSDKTGGIWLVHSVPNFPPANGSYHYPSSGTNYGQSFLCISLNLQNLETVGTQLQYNQPVVYSSFAPIALQAVLPNLTAAAKNISVRRPPWYHKAELTSIEGTSFVSFAKNKKFGKDLYADWVSIALKSSLDVETWPNGPNKLNSTCNVHYKVFNVLNVAIKEANASFTNTRDHSKWAVSKQGSGNWICIGDINRMKSQRKRGGGTVCMSNEKLSSLYQTLITSVQDC